MVLACHDSQVRVTWALRQGAHLPDTGVGGPFVRLTTTLAAAFPEWSPYGGTFDEIVPHLSTGAALTSTGEEVVRESPPISSIADEATLT